MTTLATWQDAPHLMRARVMHKRTRPREHGFNYHVYYLSLPMQGQATVSRGIFSVNRFNLLSFLQRDHGARDGNDSATWARSMFERYGLAPQVARTVLITMPRILGYVFNPVSFWLGFNAQGALVAAIAEVNNTFHETHSYVLAKSDHSPIGPDDWITTSKDFHVSPFLAVEGSYRFRFALRDEKIGIFIDHYGEDGALTLLTSMVGPMVPMTQANLWRAFLGIPLVTIKVIALIHYEAIRLMLKKIRYRNKPPQQPHKVTPWS